MLRTKKRRSRCCVISFCKRVIKIWNAVARMIANVTVIVVVITFMVIIVIIIVKRKRRERRKGEEKEDDDVVD